MISMNLLVAYLSKNPKKDYKKEDPFPEWDWKTLWLYNLLTECFKGKELKELINKYPLGLSLYTTAYFRQEDDNKVILGDQNIDSNKEFEIDKNHLFELIDRWTELAYAHSTLKCDSR
jgi:hypothetical protein